MLEYLNTIYCLPLISTIIGMIIVYLYDKFEKKQYTIGDNGQWVPVGQRGTKAPPIQSSLSALFDKITGRSPSSAAAPRKPITVTTPNEINVTRGINGRWIRSDDNTEVTDPREIKGLNQLAINQRVMQQKAQGA